MEVILDTNVLFALPRATTVIKLVDKLLERKVKLLVPEFIIEELISLKEKMMKYTGFSEEEFVRFMENVKALVEIVPEEKYRPFLEEAKRISPHKKDIPLFALSIAFNKSPIWSREPRLKRQKFVKVLDDKALEELIKRL